MSYRFVPSKEDRFHFYSFAFKPQLGACVWTHSHLGGNLAASGRPLWYNQFGTQIMLSQQNISYMETVTMRNNKNLVRTTKHSSKYLTILVYLMFIRKEPKITVAKLSSRSISATIDNNSDSNSSNSNNNNSSNNIIIMSGTNAEMMMPVITRAGSTLSRADQGSHRSEA